MKNNSQYFNKNLFAMVIFCLTTLLSCDNNSPPLPSQASLELLTAPTSEFDSIEWFSGSIEQAFEQAVHSQKPLFLYWGADWCPYCSQLQATIFQRREFISQSRLVIPVYLDGDKLVAQQLANQFNVQVYPTVIVLSPSQEEITRIPGSVDLEAYTQVLQLAVNHQTPVKQLVNSVLNGEPLTEQQWLLLAYYGWDLDYGHVVTQTATTEAASELFLTLASQCPETLAIEKSRLYMRAITQWLEHPNSASKIQLEQAFIKIINSKQQQYANLDTLLFKSHTIFSRLLNNKPALATEKQRWQQQLRHFTSDQNLSKTQQLWATRQYLQFEKITSPNTLSQQNQHWAQQQVHTADQQAKTRYERQSMLNAAWFVLREAGLNQQAKELYLKELETTNNPHYYLLNLAHLSKQDGQSEQSLQWFEQAWQQANGSATRFLWGANYLLALLELSPDDEARIEQAGNQLLDELVQNPEAGLFQYSRKWVDKISSQLSNWSEFDEHEEIIKGFKIRMNKVCLKIDNDSPATHSCKQFLADEF